jgi:hypothetical protein
MPRCYANPSPVYQPAMRLIAAITQSFPATVTTTFAHQYVSGTIVRLDIPLADGMQQADQYQGPINVTSTTQFTVPLDTTNFDPFSIPGSPPPYVNICAQVIPIGELTSTSAASTVNVLGPLT